MRKCLGKVSWEGVLFLSPIRSKITISEIRNLPNSKTTGVRKLSHNTDHPPEPRTGGKNVQNQKSLCRQRVGGCQRELTSCSFSQAGPCPVTGGTACCPRAPCGWDGWPCTTTGSTSATPSAPSVAGHTRCSSRWPREVSWARGTALRSGFYGK